jgi:spore germination protein PB
MNFFIQQDIRINTLRISGITNSSVLQIGSAGIIKPVSNLYNTGGYTQNVPDMEAPRPQRQHLFQPPHPVLVPLPSP